MSADTERIVRMHQAGYYMAEEWIKNPSAGAPVSYEHSFFVRDEWVKVTVDYDYTRGGRQPMRRAEDKADE